MTPEDQWISRTEAGLRLGTPEHPLSARRIQELAKTGRIQSRLERDPDTGHMSLRIHAGSVERFLFEREHTQHTQRDIHNIHSSEPNGNLAEIERKSNGKRTEAIDQVTRYLATIARPALSAPSARLWLTISESAAYSGLPTAVIVDFIGKGKLAAMDVGRRRGGRWRIRRVDLEAFAG